MPAIDVFNVICAKTHSMKKIAAVLLFSLFNSISFCQACEERENKILTLTGAFSAGFIYNTYGLIGAVSDGFIKDAYSKETVTQLMNAQKGMADNFISMFNENLNETNFPDEKNRDFLNSKLTTSLGVILYPAFNCIYSGLCFSVKLPNK